MAFRSLASATLLVFLISSTASHAEDFDITFISSETDSLKSEKHTLVDGGYVDGLQEGMTGKVWYVDNDGYRKELGTGWIMDVSKYMASCNIPRDSGSALTSLPVISLEIPLPDEQLLLEQGYTAFGQRDYERAEFYFVKALTLNSLADRASVQQLADSCSAMVEKERNRKLTKEERANEEKRVPIHLILGIINFNQARLGPAEYYLDKVLRIDKRHKVAKDISKLIQRIREYDSKQSGHDVVDFSLPDSLLGATAGTREIDKLPKMTKKGMPDYPVVALERHFTAVIGVKSLVDKRGKVRRSMVRQPSPWFLLDNAAVVASYKCEFEPAVADGEPINIWVEYRYSFEL